ncbi:MAG: hypothetical protein EB145_18590 [Proteobacteria bacterium]|nr:hypothetical protein [Pseudomonadota bacterium]
MGWPPGRLADYGSRVRCQSIIAHDIIVFASSICKHFTVNWVVSGTGSRASLSPVTDPPDLAPIPARVARPPGSTGAPGGRVSQDAIK